MSFIDYSFYLFVYIKVSQQLMFSAYANIRTNCLFSYDAGGIAKCVCDSYYNIQINFKGN